MINSYPLPLTNLNQKRRGAMTRFIKNILCLVAVFALVLLVFPAVAPGGETVKVGLPISLTGKYDVLGMRNLHGAKLWAEWVNENGGIFVKDKGRKLPVKVIWYDTKSDKDTTIKLTEKLITEDKVHFLLGPYGSSLTLASAAITEKYGKLMFSHSGASDKIWKQGFKYVIGVLTPSSYYYKSTMELMASLDPPIKTVAIITEDNPFNLSIRKGIKRWAKELGFKVVFDEVYPSPPTDLSPILSKVKRLKPDAILTCSHFKDGVLLAKQAAELRVYTKFFALGSAPSTVEWWKAVGPKGAQYTAATSQWEPMDAPDPSRFSNWFGPSMTANQFNAWYKKRWGKPTDFRGTQAFAAGLVLQWAIERAGSLNTDEVRAALNKMDIITLYGRSKIDPATGIQVGHGMVVAQWQDGKKVVVGPPDIAVGKLVYPRPR
ncbi:MAG: branched-chain amino acid ABC transporter substrate-binding protein [Deltaproteobacteria bacterium]|nr:MAG: branched-chain amino acid ABC transporter substrate-binding protein [Deltaproteobacteria bacterium]